MEKVGRNASAASGSRVFLRLVRLHIRDLIVLNLIYLFFCIPLVTIGPATAALYYVVCDLVRERPVSVWDCFLRGWKENWKAGAVCGGGLAILVLVAVLTVCMFAIHAMEVPVGWVVVLLAAVLLVFVTAVGSCLFPLLVTVRMPATEAIKYAFFLLAMKPGRTLLLSAGMALWAGGILLLMPFSMVVLLLGMFSLPAQAASLHAWGMIRRYVIKLEL